jgi:hypothetical protein
MRKQSWVVYTMPLKDNAEGIRAVCDAQEWVKMERAKPGFFAPIQDGIPNEGEAERLARGRSGEAKSRAAKAHPTSLLTKADALLAAAKVPAG